MCKVLAAESKLRPSLTRERKKLNSRTAIMMVPVGGKHESDEDELETQLVHAVFAEKSYAKVFES